MHTIITTLGFIASGVLVAITEGWNILLSLFLMVIFFTDLIYKFTKQDAKVGK